MLLIIFSWVALWWTRELVLDDIAVRELLLVDNFCFVGWLLSEKPPAKDSLEDIGAMPDL
jgi:hypothetical protein